MHSRAISAAFAFSRIVVRVKSRSSICVNLDRSSCLSSRICAPATGPGDFWMQVLEDQPQHRQLIGSPMTNTVAYCRFQDPDTQQVREAEGLDRIDNGSGDILRSQA